MPRPAELDFLTGLRAGLLATAFLAVALRDDFFAAGFLTAAALTGRFGLPRGFSGGFPRFSDNLRRLGRQKPPCYQRLGRHLSPYRYLTWLLESCLRQMDHRALHGRELLLFVVLIHGRPSAFANSKASEF